MASPQISRYGSANLGLWYRSAQGPMVRFFQSRGFPVHPGELALLEGASGGLAVVLMVGFALIWRQPQVVWAAYAAFWTCLADNRAAASPRFRAMAGFVLWGTVIAPLVTAFAAPGSHGTGLGVAVLVSLCIYLGSKRSETATVGVLLGVVAVIAAEQPAGLADAPRIALAFFCGGSLALSLRMASVSLFEKPSELTRPAVQQGSPTTAASARHAILCGTAALVTYMGAHWASLSYPQWATMAAVLVTNIDVRASWQRTLERVLGSVIGGVLAFAISTKLSQPLALIGLVLPLATATIALRAVNYTLFVCFLTPLFVLVTAILSPSDGRWAAEARAADNIIGSIVALMTCLLFLTAAEGRGWIRNICRLLTDSVPSDAERRAIATELDLER